MNDVGIIISIIFSYAEPVITFAIMFALLGESIRRHLKAYLIASVFTGSIIFVMKIINLDQGTTFIITLIIQLILLFILIRRVWWIILFVFFITVVIIAVSEQISVITLLFITNSSIEQMKHEYLIEGVFSSMALKCLFLLILLKWNLRVFREEPNTSNKKNSKR
jgi:hypothetical protein